MPGFQQFAPHAVNFGPLLVHDIVILKEVFTNLKVVSFDLALGIFDGFGNHGVLNRLAFFHTQLRHDAGDTV